MKKIITISVFAITFFAMNVLSFAQSNLSDKDYAAKKDSFYKLYQQYKFSLTNNGVANKPIDPSGLFMIDEHNNFVEARKSLEVNEQYNSNGPWINNEKDLAGGYTWAQTNTTYTVISGGTTLGTVSNDDNTFPANPIGFTFVYDGVSYTTVDINANGYLKFGTISGSNYPYILSLQTLIFAGNNNDLRANNTTSNLQYLTSGVAGSRVFTIQWSNYGFYNAGWDGSDFSFQMKLYETTNKVEVVFGAYTNIVNPGGLLVQSGINNATTDFNCRTTTTNWAATTAGGSNTAALTCTNTIKPASGLTWTWSPPPSGQMGYYSSAASQVQPGVPLLPGTLNAQIIKVAIQDTGISSAISITNFKFGTAGSNNPAADILNAKLYFTGSSNVFSTSVQYGSTVTSPNGTFYVNGSAVLVANATNYFWLTYDLSGSAISGDSVDALCDSITGTGVMGTVAPNPQSPAGSNPLDYYCLGQVSNAGCPFGLYITNVNIGNINNTTGCNGVLPYVYTNYTNLSTTVRQNNPYSMSVTNQNIGNPNPTAFGIWVDWNNNNSFADAGEYFPTTIIPANTTTSAFATINVPSGAVLGNHRMRIRCNLSTAPTAAQFCALLTYGEQEDYTLNVIPDTNMTYSSSTTTQTVTSAVFTPSNNTQIIGMQVNTFGTLTPINATSFSLSTAGSTNPATDISRAKLWYTGTNPNFGTTTQFGNTAVSPNGAFTITGSQALSVGTNYFWLTYDVPLTATANDTLDAQCNSITVGGIPRTPTVTSPAGNRIIGSTSLSGNYTIPGSYPNFTTAINDLNLRGTSGPVTFNVAPGFMDTVVNLTITTSGTAAKPIVFKNAATTPLVNPLITAGVGVGTTDGIFKLNGSDYITFDGIDLQENALNTTTTTQMEWGYALLKPSGTDGCQNVTIKNCTITLNKTNTASVGIYANNHPPTSAVTWVVTNVSGANSNNTFLNDNISNAYIGISINGYVDVTPFTFYDQNNTINTCNVTNFGGTATSAYGIFDIYQNGLTITNCNINSAGGVNSSGLMGGIYNSTMNNSDLTVSNNTVSLVNTSTSTTVYGIFCTAASGTVNNVNILNNTIQNCDLTAALSTSFYNIYCGAPCANLTVSGNRIKGYNYGTSSATTTVVYTIYSISTTASSITITNNLDSGNTINGTTAYTNYRIYNGVTTNNATITGNKIKNNILCGTTAASTVYGIYNSAGTYTCNMSNNEVSNNSLPTTSSHSMYFLYNVSPAPVNDYNNNLVTGNTSSGSGTLFGMGYSASPGLGSVVNITNNTVTNLSKTTANGLGVLYGIYSTGSAQGTTNINNNTVTGFTSAAATTIYGMYQNGSPPNFLNMNGNKIGNLSNAGNAPIYGMYDNGIGTTRSTNSQDSIFNLSSSLGGTIYGMYVQNAFLRDVNNNKISGITSSANTASIVYGLYSADAVAGTLNIYNNFISDINAPASTSIAPAVSGIYIGSGLATTNINLFYNSVYLNTTSSSVSTFSTAALYAFTTPVVDMRNNILVNKSVAGPTAGSTTAAYRRSGTILTAYSNNSNNNCLYSGVPSAFNVLYYDGTNSDQTISAYKTRVVPRDNNSITENVPFVNGTTAPYDLRVQTTVPTGCESGGKIVSSPVNITTDIYSTARYPNSGYPIGGFTPVAPDIGAHEFGGLNADLAPPLITYTPLGNGGTSNRSFQNVVITDASGVNTTPGTKPRCYYKRSTDGNVINTNLNTSDGWKYAEATGTTSPFDFTIDYSLLNGGTGVTTGQVVQYFVIAQDNAGSPNVGANQATFNTSPVSVALLAANAPIANTLSYTINTNTFSGNINVGTAQTYTNLTGAAGLFQAINSGTVAGNITITITSDMTEDGTNGLNILNETGAGGYFVRIIPSDATVKVISGTVANGMIRLNGARKVTIDGGSFFAENKIGSQNNPVPGKFLTFRNSNGSQPVFTFINDAVRDSIKYCTIESNNINTGSATVFFSTTTGTQGNDSNVIANCDIRDLSNITGYPAQGIYSLGTTTTLPQYNNFNTITNCNIYNNYYDVGLVTAAIQLTSGSSDWTISNNSFYQTIARAPVSSSTFIGVYNASTLNNNITVTNNYFGGSAPLCGSTPMTYNGAGLYNYYAIQLLVGGIFASSVQGNTIQNIALTTSPASSLSTFFRAIYVNNNTSWVNIGNISGNTIGSGTGTGSITLTTNTTASSYTIHMIHHNGFGSIMNNTIGSITFAGNSTGTADLYGGMTWFNSIQGQILPISNNLIGSLTTPNSIQVTNLLNGSSLRGMYLQNGAGTQTNVTSNVVANLTSLSPTANALSSVYGIQTNNAVNANYNFTGNTVRNLVNNSNYNLGASFSMGGIFSTALGQNNYTQNTIYSIYANGTGSGTPLVGGILAGGSSTLALGGTVSRNKMYDFRLSGTGTFAPAPLLLGINVQGNAPYTVTNNMVSITNGDASSLNLHEPDNYKQVVVEKPEINLAVLPKEGEYKETIQPVEGPVNPGLEAVNSENKAIRENLVNKDNKNNVANNKDNTNSSAINTSIAGVYMTSASTGACNYYYNTFYVGGNQPGGGYNSWAFVKTSSGVVTLRNNLLINARTGGAGFQYILGNENANPLQGWNTSASNYNACIGSNDATFGEWGLGNNQTLGQWLTSTGGDKQTWATNTGVINPTNLLTSISAGDLTIQSGNAAAWLVSGKGIALSGVNNDFQGDARVIAISGGCTDIGADEFVVAPPSNPVATQGGTPGAGQTTTYTLYGRTLCSIDWGVGGTSYPTSVTVNYQSGINPPTNITTPNRSSNSYWNIVPVGTLAGTTYDITVNFGDNETYSIVSPSTNTLLAKNTNFWQVYPAGNGAQMSDVSWSNLTATLRGVNALSVFALADAAFPSVKLISPPNNALNQGAIDTLVWTRSASATSYRVQLATDSLFNTIVRDSTTSDSTKIVSGLVNNTNYWWRVYGTNGVGIGAFSMLFKFKANFILPPAIVNLTVIPGGFYNTGTGKLNMRDTIRTYLVDSTTCLRVDSSKGVLDSVTFGMALSYSNANTGSYYLFVYHRNHLAIASRLKQGIVRGSSVNYNFTTDSAKAYGFNMIKVATGPDKWGMIPGDANQDGFNDGLDQTIWILENGLDGYLRSDFNGDSFADGLDQTLWILYNGLSTFLPCGFEVWQPSKNETDYLKQLEAKFKIQSSKNNNR